MVNVAIIGCGSWGKNLIRVFNQISTVRVCCHTGDPNNARWIRENYSGVSLTTEYDNVLDDEKIDAVVVATPIETHYQIVRKALRSGKNVFVEKPLTSRTDRAKELANLSAQKNIVLFVGYIFVHHPVFQKIETIHQKSNINQIRFSWEKLGGFAEDIVENLASHDFAMAYRLFGTPPKSITVCDELGLYGQRNAVTLNASFDNGRCHIALNRLSNRTQKTVTVATESDGLFVWNDNTLLEFDEKEEQFNRRFESTIEPLKRECEVFVDAIVDDQDPITDGEFGVEITRAIEQVNRSCD